MNNSGGAIVSNSVLTDRLSVPLNGSTTAHVEIDSGTGNLVSDRLAGEEQEEVLASGTLEYLEKQGVPAHTVATKDGEATLTLKGEGGRRSLFRFPWDACGGGAYEWQISLNPGVRS